MRRRARFYGAPRIEKIWECGWKRSSRDWRWPASVTVRNLDGVEFADLPNILSQAPPVKLRTARLRFTPETLLLQLVATALAG